MKKLIALAIVAVMLVAMAATVLANETVYAAPVSIDKTGIGDGTITDGEYGRPVAHISSNSAYNIDEDDDVIDGYNGYAYYQQCDPFEQDIIVYIAVSGDTTGPNAGQAGARLYFAVDQLIKDGKYYGHWNGLAGEDHWSNSAIQWRVSFYDEPTGDPALASAPYPSGKASNIIASLCTKNSADGYVGDGFVLASFTGETDGVIYSFCDHLYDRNTLKDSGAYAGSIGMHGNRAHYECIIRTDYFKNGSATYTFAEDSFLQPGDYFAFSLATFVSEVGSEAWNADLSWGSGIDWPTNQSTMGCCGSHKVIIPTWDEYYPAEPIDDPDPADTGDALVVVVATAVMALGTALIVKKVK